jgi:hypothetical protein
MARLVSNYTVTKKGRDFGKTFVITEMPASRAEAWATRALLALMAGGIELPDGFERMGMAGMAEVGIKALTGLKWEVAEPLLAEMFECVQIMPDKSKPSIVRDLIEQDIEEIFTRFDLRMEVWNLHAGFFHAVAQSGSKGKSKAAAVNHSRNT